MRIVALCLLPLALLAEDPAKTFTVAPGTRVPLSLINSVSTKSAGEGDRVYLETVFPIVIDGRVVIPPGSYGVCVRQHGRARAGKLHPPHGRCQSQARSGAALRAACPQGQLRDTLHTSSRPRIRDFAPSVDDGNSPPGCSYDCPLGELGLPFDHRHFILGSLAGLGTWTSRWPGTT